jgi:hypothetical protein
MEYREVASSQIRAAFADAPADVSAASLASLLPHEALAFALETGCYSPPQPLPDGEMLDRYVLRTALIERALARPEADRSALDLQRLFQLAISASTEGHALRQWLSRPESALTPHDLLRL